jgi:protein-disulfide isomerase
VKAPSDENTTPNQAPDREQEFYVRDMNAPADEEELSAVISIPRTNFNYAVIGIMCLLIGFLGGYLLADQQSRNQRAANQDLVEQAVERAMAVQLEQIQAMRPPDLSDPNSRFTVGTTDNDPALGASEDDAIVQIIEFSDFNCGYCARFATQTLSRIIDTYGDHVRFVYRDYPILADSSAEAAMAAQCANEHGEFWEFHNLLFTSESEFSRETFITMAQSLDIDTEAFSTCLDEQRYYDGMVTDYREAQSLGIRGTPAFFINGRPVSGAQEFEYFASIIEEELEANGVVLQPEAPVNAPQDAS